MPELPEVETVVRKLSPQILYGKFLGWEVYDPKLKPSLRTKPAYEAEVSAVIRLGKQIVIAFNDPANFFIAVHLRMSGRLFWAQGEPGKLSEELSRYQQQFSIKSKAHLRFRMLFDTGALLFVDPRRFGTIKASRLLDSFATVGVEPLAKSFTAGILNQLLGRSNQSIKSWLLRQDKIVGIGNIYASEILFKAGISPTREVKSLTASERLALHGAIKSILNKAVRHCGTTFSDFQSTLGETGSFQRYLAVYNREGEPCKVCKTEVRRSVQNGRSTFYCQRCQR